MIVTSRSNERVKRTRALQDAKVRKETGLHLIEGDKLVFDAAASGARIRTVFAKEGAKTPDGIETVFVSDGVMDALCSAKTPQNHREFCGFRRQRVKESRNSGENAAV